MVALSLLAPLCIALLTFAAVAPPAAGPLEPSPPQGAASAPAIAEQAPCGSPPCPVAIHDDAILRCPLETVCTQQVPPAEPDPCAAMGSDCPPGLACLSIDCLPISPPPLELPLPPKIPVDLPPVVLPPLPAPVPPHVLPPPRTGAGPTIDPTPDPLTFSALNALLPPDGLPIFVYAAQGSIRIAKCLEPTCATFFLRDIAAAPNDGRPTATLDPHGNLVVAFGHWDIPQEARLVRCRDLLCETATVTSTGILGTLSAATEVLVGPDDLPLLLFHDFARDPFDSSRLVLRLAKCLDKDCASSRVVHSDERVLASSPARLFFDAEGRPAFAYVITGYSNAPTLTIPVLGSCSDLACTDVSTSDLMIHEPGHSKGTFPLIVLGQADGSLLLAYSYFSRVEPGETVFRVVRCPDIACAAPEVQDQASFPRYEGVQAILQDGDEFLVAVTEVSRLRIERCSSLPCDEPISVYEDSQTGFLTPVALLAMPELATVAVHFTQMFQHEGHVAPLVLTRILPPEAGGDAGEQRP